MEQTTQQNAALVEQAAAAAQSLQEQAHKLTAAVATFKLDDAHNLAFTAPLNTIQVPVAPAKARISKQAAPRKALPAAAQENDWEQF
jgi:methyl-accepting chemotaxis protein